MTVLTPDRADGAESKELGATPEPQAQAREGVLRILGTHQLGRFSGFFVFAVLFLIFSLWVPDSFLTAATWKTIAQSQAITAILAVSLLVPLAARKFDLSAAQNVGFSALVCGSLMVNEPHLGVVPAILVTLAVGTMIGVVNGVLVGVVGLDSFIVTLGTLSLLTGGAAIVADGNFIGPFPTSFTGITDGSVAGVPILAVYALIFAILAWYVIEHTPLGRRLYATGANPDAARLAGIQTARMVFWSMVASGLFASFTGVLLASNLNTVSETIGPQYLLPAFAAAFLGTTQIKLGRFNVWGTLVAIVLLGVGVQGLQLAGADIWVTNIFNGAALILAVYFALLLVRRRKRKEVAVAEEAATS